MAKFTLTSVVIGVVAFLTFLAAPAYSQIGGLDAGFHPGAILKGSAPGVIYAVRAQSDGKVVIAGDFTSVGGTARGGIARLNVDGSLDTGFATGEGANGAVRALAVQSDGKFVIGGDFTTVDSVSRIRVARLSASGAVDSTFTPGTGANGVVNAIQVSGSSIYIGGDFTKVNDQTRVRLARLGSSGAPDSFMSGAAGPDAAVYALALGSSFTGSVSLYVGGAFTSFNGSSRLHLAAIGSSTGTLDNSFNATGGPDGAVLTMLFADGGPANSQLFIGGDFANVGSVPRGRLAAYTIGFTSATLDPVFNVWVDARVTSLAVSSTGSASQMLIGGDFTVVNGQGRNRLARIKMTASSQSPGGTVIAYDLDPSFNSPAGADATVRALAVTSDGKTVVGGDFTSIAGAPAAKVARLYSDAGSQPPVAPSNVSAQGVSSTQVIVSFNGSSYATTYRIERSPDGVNSWTLAASQSSAFPFTDGGLSPASTWFYRVTASNSNGDSPLSASVSATTAATEWTGAGALDPSAAGSGTNGAVESVFVQPDGKILIGGTFTTVHGAPRKNVARLLPDWSVDPAFDPGTGPSSTVYCVAAQPDGKVLIGGAFSTVNGSSRQYLARLNANGTLDAGFIGAGSVTNSLIDHIALQPDGRLLIAGSFSTVYGRSHPYLARLNSDGSLDDSFMAAPSTSVEGLDVQRDGRILTGGFFFNMNGFDADYMMRLLPNGDIDDSFNAGSGGAFISSVIGLNNGKILVCGSFSSFSGQARKYIVRLNADGSMDASFNPGAGPDGRLTAMAAQADGKVLIAGDFTKVAGAVRPHLARLNADGTLDATFQPGAGTFNTVNAIAVCPDTRVVVAGDFTTFGNGTPSRIARLVGDGYSAAPAAPTGLSVSEISASSVRVTWSDLPSEQSWKLERSLSGTSGWISLPPLPWDVTAFVDTGLQAGTTYFYRLRASNSAGDSSYSATVSGRTLTAFEQWKLDSGLSLSALDDNDDDGDGIPLLVEYALGLDPHVSATEGMPVHQVINGALALSYRKFRADVLYSVEASTDMQNWSTEGVTQGSGAFPIAWKMINGAPQMFLRLRVTRP